MPKRASSPSLTLLPRERGVPAYRWLCEVLRAEILEGRLRPGARLPATRELALRYGLARGTIVAAFDELQAQGYVAGATGSGTYVNKVLPDALLEVERKPKMQEAPPRVPSRRLSRFGRSVTLLDGLEAGPARAFRANVPAIDLFPTTLWAQIASRRLRQASPSQLRGCGPLGDAGLREAVADYLIAARGVRCSVEQVAIVLGVQEALDLVARVLLDRGDRACMEEPGYSGAAQVFEACGAKISPIRLDEEGMRIPSAKLRDARLVYVTPAHQFPTGVVMSLPRRLALLEWARSCGALIFEDDYDSEYRYRGRPIPALQGLDRSGQVLFSGSFSKVLFPSLRLGYLVLPPDLVDRFAAAMSVRRRHLPVLEQLVVRDFIVDGHFGRHLRRMREVYAERLNVLLTSAAEHLEGALEISSVEAGLQTAGWLAPDMDARAIASEASARRVEVIPLDVYARGRLDRPGLQLGFAAVEPSEIRRGVLELASILERRPTQSQPLRLNMP